jgi:hypothetical protein
MKRDRAVDLLAKQDITDVIMTYARALDRLDEPLLRSVFHPNAQHEHFYKGPSSDPERVSSGDDPADFVAFALGVLRTHKRTHHQLGNIFVELDTDEIAFAESYFTAYHRMRPKGDPLAGSDAFDTEMDFLVGGRYIDRFACIDGVWKITHRTGMTDWMRLEPPLSSGYGNVDDNQIGKQGVNDFLYRRKVAYSI